MSSSSPASSSFVPRPVVVSLGDPSGIGPEVLRKALAEPDLASARLILVGDLDALETAPGPPLAHRAGLELVSEPEETGGLALARAVDRLVSGEAEALVTGPIEKARVARVLGDDFVGQTEYVAQRFGCAGSEVMMLAGERLRVALLTTHLAVRDVADRLSLEGTLRILRTVDQDARRWLGIERPRIVLTALNPHAGEGGRFGDEEQRILEPAVWAARAAGVLVDGPLPADSLFGEAVQGAWDIVVACYHDQGLGPLKLCCFHDAVNITLGLPRLRVSPDHGPARAIAGRGEARHESMARALRMALRCAARPEEGPTDHA